jgi:hypothetical protein
MTTTSVSKSPKVELPIQHQPLNSTKMQKHPLPLPFMENLHASTKSRWTNFSSSTGNSTNPLVNTKQFALTHKACALALANEQKKSADSEHKNMALSSRIQELEEMLARGGPLIKESPPPASALGAQARISFQNEMAVDEPSVHSAPEEFHNPSPYNGMTNYDGSDSDSDDRSIPPHPTKNPPVTSVPRDPSKTCLPKHMADNDLPIPIHGGGGTTSRGSGSEFVEFSNSPNTNSEYSNLLN